MIQVSRQIKIGILFALTVIGIITAMFAEPFPQAAGYHNFADQRMMYGVPNLWNVLSNLPFALFGCIGLYKISMTFSSSKPENHRNAYTLFFAGTMLVASGSAWYHLNPTNDSLFWDRLPMTIAFMALLSIVISEYVSDRVGRLLLWPLIIFGLLSVTYWYMSELRGSGDLRLYVLVQFLPMILLTFILVLFKPFGAGSTYLWAMLAFYLFSKIAEHFDAEIFDLLGWMGGHSIKHFLASLGVLCFYIHMHHLEARPG